MEEEKRIEGSLCGWATSKFYRNHFAHHLLFEPEGTQLPPPRTD